MHNLLIISSFNQHESMQCTSDWLPSHIETRYRSKYIIRTVVINIVAVYIAYRITMAFFLEEQDMLKRGAQGGMPAMDPLDAEF